MVRNPYGNLGEKHALKPVVHMMKKEYVMTLEQEYAHPLPMYLSTADGRTLENDESVIELPPFSYQSLCGVYSEIYDATEYKTSLRTFRRSMNDDMVDIRIYGSERGICDPCMAYLHKMRLVSDGNMAIVGESWGEHLTHPTLKMGIASKSQDGFGGF